MTEFLLGLAIGMVIGFGIGFFALGIIIGIRERDDEPTD